MNSSREQAFDMFLIYTIDNMEQILGIPDWARGQHTVELGMVSPTIAYRIVKRSAVTGMDYFFIQLLEQEKYGRLVLRTSGDSYFYSLSDCQDQVKFIQHEFAQNQTQPHP